MERSQESVTYATLLNCCDTTETEVRRCFGHTPISTLVHLQVSHDHNWLVRLVHSSLAIHELMTFSDFHVVSPIMFLLESELPELSV